MNTKLAIRNLQIITALNSLSYGLIYPFISPYILKLGGDHVHIGILTIGNLIGELLSPDVIKIFTHLSGKRYSLFFILNTALVTHLMLVLTNSYWFTIIVRLLFSITNQSQNLCHDLLLSKVSSEEEKQKLSSNYSVLSGMGYVLGPIISGYLFDFGFGYTGILATCLALISSILLMKVKTDEQDVNPEHAAKSVLEKATEKISENIVDLQKSDYKKNWDVLVMKYCFASSVMIFFSKFSLILKSNYEGSSVMVGYIAAYINILVFAATYFSTVVMPTVEAYPERFISEILFFLLMILIFLACYAPYYELFMLLLIPVTFFRTILMNLWKDLFAERKNINLNKLNQTVSVFAGITTPLVFGIFCNRIAKDAVTLFSCLPIFTCWIITRYYSRNLKLDFENKDK